MKEIWAWIDLNNLIHGIAASILAAWILAYGRAALRGVWHLASPYCTYAGHFALVLLRVLRKGVNFVAKMLMSIILWCVVLALAGFCMGLFVGIFIGILSGIVIGLHEASVLAGLRGFAEGAFLVALIFGGCIGAASPFMLAFFALESFLSGENEAPQPNAAPDGYAAG